MTSQLDLSKIYTRTRMTRRLAIPPSMLTSNIEENLFNILRKEVEGKVVAEGFVEEGSVEIKDHGPFETEVIRFNGFARVNVTFVANVCNPTKDDEIDCEVKRFNQFGIMAIAGPLNIVIQGSKKKIQLGQILKVRVISRKLRLNDNQIDVYSQLASEGSSEEVEETDEVKEADDSGVKGGEDLVDINSDDEEDEGSDEEINSEAVPEEVNQDEQDEQDGGYSLDYNIKDEEDDGDYEGGGTDEEQEAEREHMSDEDGDEDEDGEEDEEENGDVPSEIGE